MQRLVATYSTCITPVLADQLLSRLLMSAQAVTKTLTAQAHAGRGRVKGHAPGAEGADPGLGPGGNGPAPGSAPSAAVPHAATESAGVPGFGV